MRKLQNYIVLFVFMIVIAIIWNCSGGQQLNQATIERPHDPWVFRSVMDGEARMLTVALHDDLWASYSATNGAIRKVWKGGVNFDGAVYTTVHGPQPSSLGDAYFENKYLEQPWTVSIDGKTTKPNIQFKGHRFEKGQLRLNYDLQLADGQKIQVQEMPEFTKKADGQVGIERIFTLSNVPTGATLTLKTNLSSVPLESSVETDGTFNMSTKTEREAKNLKALDLEGELILNNNASTRFAAYFVKHPLIENPNKVKGAEEEELPLGYRLIARNDCKTCHNTNVKTIGPAYVDVAKKYRNNEENLALLTSKVVNGGAGVWGPTLMNAHPNLPESDIRIMVQYILDLDKKEEAEILALEAAQTPENIDFSAATELGIEDVNIGPIVSVYVYPDKKIEKLADIDESVTPVYVGQIPNIDANNDDLKNVGLADNFALIYTGYINIPKDNNYVFRLSSDDGSSMSINGQEIINNDGLHGEQPRDGEVALSKGYHPFEVRYFQCLGGKMLRLEWRSFNDGQFKVVPTQAFAHDADLDITAVRMGGNIAIPGDKMALKEVHPSFNLCQARPESFAPKVGGMDFLSDGRMLVSTWDAEGGIHLISGAMDCDPAKMSVKKIASGLAEPLGLKVVDDEIYVLQKQELTKLIDHDGDDIIDEYQTLANSWTVSANFHEFAFGLDYKDNHFYAALATGIMPGGASMKPQPKDRGKVVKINRTTGKVEFVAHGLRTPNGIAVGIDEQIFVADNQGDWLPSSKIMHIEQGDFLGSRSVDFEGTANLPVKQPMVWLPQDEIGNSPTQPAAINVGPYKGQMLHGELTHGGVKRVFVEEVNGQYQGGVFRFIQGLEAGVNRLIWGPDGALYAGGVGSSGNWSQSGKLWYGLQRLEYNNESAFEMLAVRAKADGIEIEFTEALSERDGWEFEDYEIKQWRYVPTAEYGGPKIDEQELNILSVNRAADGKKVFLELEGMKEGHVLYVHLPNNWISAQGHEIWTTECWYTLNQIPDEAGTRHIATRPSLAQNTLTDAEKAAGWQLLFDGETMNGWHTFNQKEAHKSWQVKDGAMAFSPVENERGDIVTDAEFENFELELEWKISPCGNSGIMYYVQEGDFDHPWLTGPEMQVLDNTCHPDAKIETHRAGDLYDMIACKYETVLPANQWNKVRIISDNGRLEHWLNGRKLVATTLWDDKWKDMIANSKFKEMPDFGKFQKGHICLQDHDDKVWYRNIKIRELGEAL